MAEDSEVTPVIQHVLLYVNGTVQRDASWVENGLKQCLLMNHITASLLFFNFKETPSREKQKTSFGI
jgi:hypothetical protein